MSLLTEGQVLRGTWEVERYLGSGAFAEVYRVRHRFLGRQALKIFKTVGATVAEVNLMLGEALMLTRIGHPNIVRVFEANTLETPEGSRGFLTMEYVAGGSLDKFWNSHGAEFVPVDTSVEIIRQICEGLTVAHQADPPIVHRDIKPQNLLVGYDRDGLRVRVTDFGLAKQVNPLTLMASTRGTRAFKAPEALKDVYSDSCAGDVWALGVTMYLLLTDQLPFEIPEDPLAGPSSFSIPPTPPSRLNIDVDSRLDTIVAKALQIDPAERYNDALALLDDLVSWSPRVTSAPNKPNILDGSHDSKVALGAQDLPDAVRAHKMADNAIAISRSANTIDRLFEAADLMEEAFNLTPDLRAEHEYRVRLWRRGMTM